ncbi:hypothetical protein EMILIAHAH_66 [Bacillus phage vB_BanH_Emiliahah]|nr:hypothetical protein EMILIAHAH_66 [Bacillus phage vB_BanH_Emiliahah]
MTVYTNYKKGLNDGYRIAKYNKLPLDHVRGSFRGIKKNDTKEYLQGIIDGKRLYLIDKRKETLS